MNRSYRSFLEQNGSSSIRMTERIGFKTYQFHSSHGYGTTGIYELGSYATISFSDHLYYNDFEYSIQSEDSVVIHQYDSILSDDNSRFGQVHPGMQYIERTTENELQRYTIKKGTPAKIIGLQLMPEYYDYYLKKEFNIKHSMFEEMLRCNTREVCIPTLSSLFHQLVGFTGDSISSTIFYRAKVDEAVSLLFQNAKMTHKGVAISKAEYKTIMYIAEYMSNHVDIALSLSEMAEYAYMSPAKFKYTFQSVIGHSFSEHFFLLRMAKACDLLLHSSEYITSIAQKVGYKNVGSFSAQFKRYTGILPSEYRAVKGGLISNTK